MVICLEITHFDGNLMTLGRSLAVLEALDQKRKIYVSGLVTRRMMLSKSREGRCLD